MAHDDFSNYFSYFALLIWPAVALYLYSRLSIAEATMWTILGGYLLLPVGTYFHFQGFPIQFDKRTIPTLSALIGCIFGAGRRPEFFRKFGLAEALILYIMVCPLISSILNGDTLQFGPLVLPGVGAYDGIPAVIAETLAVLPFFLGRQFLRNSEDNTRILWILAVTGLAYSFPMLFEVRISPQLHYWLYGHLAFGFSSEVRDGGFRPMVFIGNGLLVAFFAMMSMVAATALWRTQTRITRFAPANITTGYLGVVLVLCKTLSALLYAAVLVPLVRWASPRLQLRVACVLVSIALIYPALRFADLVPTATLVHAASVVSDQRAGSLKLRFDQEQQLLDRALKRPWFGWGRYGRNCIYNQYGSDMTISDGYWVNVAGSYGLLDCIAVFGLLALTVFRAAMALKYISTMKEQIHFAALALIVGVNVINLVPNTSITGWTWLMVGALLGRAEMLQAMARKRMSVGMQRSPVQTQIEPNPSG